MFIPFLLTPMTCLLISYTATSVSIKHQKEMLEEYAAKNGFVPYEIAGDDGVSGIVFDRPSFNAMMAFIQDGGANCIITKDLSRLGRNAIDSGYYIERYFPSLSVRFIAITDNIDTLTDSTDGLFVSVKSILNEYYDCGIIRLTSKKTDSKEVFLPD
jgi:DNA invertase Pin-like site-specific DNA recombinase